MADPFPAIDMTTALNCGQQVLPIITAGTWSSHQRTATCCALTEALFAAETFLHDTIGPIGEGDKTEAISLVTQSISRLQRIVAEDKSIRGAVVPLPPVVLALIEALIAFLTGLIAK